MIPMLFHSIDFSGVARGLWTLLATFMLSALVLGFLMILWAAK